ncbi:MAG TPA: hypothetical protein VFV95_14295 [Vicinamibacterales bacterium]|nr:hypothetical protein [Vicinamibacterales bacterium]
MREHEFGILTKTCATAAVALLFVVAVQNMAAGNVPHPRAFPVVLLGLVCFSIGKLSVIARRRWVSFGSGCMSMPMANIYRTGYWLMGVGILVTFL